MGGDQGEPQSHHKALDFSNDLKVSVHVDRTLECDSKHTRGSATKLSKTPAMKRDFL